jgi:hypothetical protein
MSAYDFTVDSTSGADGKSRGDLIQGKVLSPESQFSADELASHIVIPLEWRAEANEARAVARLAVDEEGALWIRSLYGEPMLRVMIFESLKNVETQAFLRFLMKSQLRKDFVIILKFVRVPDSTKALYTEAVAREDGIEITKSLPPPMKSFPGMAISDSHAERAKRREKAAIARYQESPAFLMEFTDRVLSRM